MYLIYLQSAVYTNVGTKPCFQNGYFKHLYFRNPHNHITFQSLINRYPQAINSKISISALPNGTANCNQRKYTGSSSDFLSKTTQINTGYTFPAKVKLNQQFLTVIGRKVKLKSGMSVSANIKLSERLVISIFTDFLAKISDNLKSILE